MVHHSPASVPTRVDLWLDAYAAGFADGHDSRDDEFANLSAIADHWYFVANNPEAAARARREFMSAAEVIANRRAADEQRRQWDEQEEALFAQARAMLANGADDRTVAVELGLFLPLVANLRAGAL